MARKTNAPDLDDDMRPEYDFSKLKLIGRGIYAERFRCGTNLAQLIERDGGAHEEQSKDDDLQQKPHG
jgi:hypothetical protein